MDPPFVLFVGIDSGSRFHDACVLHADGSKFRSFRVEHSAAGLDDLAARLDVLSGRVPHTLAIAIESPRGPVVELLLERGFSLFHLNPKQLDRFRDRHSLAGAKDDRRDAYVLADSLRTDQHLFHPIQLDHTLIIQLRGATRLRTELQSSLGQATNRLREELHRTFPALLTLSPAVGNPWLWDLLSLAPSPQQLRALPFDDVSGLVKRHRLRKLKADELFATLQSPPLYVAPGVVEAASAHIQALIPQVLLLHAQVKQVDRTVAALLLELNQAAEAGEWGGHRDVAIVLSLPGIGTTLGATVLAETSQALAERDYHALRALFGVAPVTVQSGRRNLKQMRRSVSGRLRLTAFCWGNLAIQKDPRARAHYDQLRDSLPGGKPRCSHARALRGVIDRLLAVLVAMLRDQTTYEPARRRSLAA